MKKLIALVVVLVLAVVTAVGAGIVPGLQPVPEPMTQTIGSASAASPAAEVAAPTLETPAKQLIVVDAATGTVLIDKASTDRMPTASMSKVMTLYMVFEAIERGQIKLADKFTVSEKAWRMEGSKMFIQVGTQVSVEDLIRGVAIQSGNDATVALAEGIAGSEESFIEAMNKRAKEIGLANSNFMNSSGWPDPNHYSTAADLAVLAYRIINDFPQHYHYFSEREFTYNNIKQQNRDPLLGRLPGADGLKTGHTEEAGYGLIGSAIRDGRRVIMVINGLESWDQRVEESVKVMEWAFLNFDWKTIIAKDQEVTKAPVWLGMSPDVPLVAEKDVKIVLPSTAGDVTPPMTVSYDGPIAAPIVKGDKVGSLKIEMPAGQPPVEMALLAGADVPALGFFGKAGARLSHILTGGR